MAGTVQGLLRHTVATTFVLLVLAPAALATTPGYSASVAGSPSAQPLGATQVAVTAGTADDGRATVALPFPVQFFGQTVNSVAVSTNGIVYFGTPPATTDDWNNVCLPTPARQDFVAAYWDDLTTAAAGDGIFTTEAGTPGNSSHSFRIEWRAHLFGSSTTEVHATLLMFEGSNSFAVFYGAGGDGAGATIGVQGGDGSGTGTTTQFACNQASAVTSGRRIDFVARPSASTDAFSGTPGSTTAAVSGRVNPETHSTSAWFEYGTDAVSYPNSTASSYVGLDATLHNVTGHSLTGLTPSTTYHYRIVATNTSGGVTRGEDRTVTTAAASVAPPSNTSPPVVTGTAQVGQTLTVAPGTWSGSPTSYTQKWIRCAPAGSGGCTPSYIPGATATTYMLTSAELGASVYAAVTATNAGGPGAAVVSNAVGPVTAASTTGGTGSSGTSGTAGTTGTSGTSATSGTSGTTATSGTSGTTATSATTGEDPLDPSNPGRSGSASAASVLDSKVQAGPNGVDLHASCPPGGADCAGSATLRSTALGRAAAGAKPKVITVASGTFSIAAGAQGAMTLKLSGAGRKLLARRGRIKATATLETHGAPVSTTKSVVVDAFDPGLVRTVSVPVPKTGGVTVSQVSARFKVKRGRRATTPTLRVVSTGAPATLTVLGGAKRKGAGAEVSIVVLSRGAGSSGGGPGGRSGTRAMAAALSVRVELRLPAGSAPFAGTPKRNAAYCHAIPAAFGFVAGNPLLGEGLPGFTARDAVKDAYLLACNKPFATKAAFLKALQGSAGTTGGTGTTGATGTTGETGTTGGGPTRGTGTGSGSLSAVPGQADQVRFTASFTGPVRVATILFPRTGGTLVEAPSIPGATCSGATPDPADVDPSDPSTGYFAVSCRATSPDALIPANTAIAGVVSLSPAPTAGMGATASAVDNTRTRYAATLTGP
jgi:hypothetical protein